MRRYLDLVLTGLIALFGFILLSTPAALAAKEDAIGKVIAIRGDVTAISQNSETRKLTLKSLVFLQDTIKTNHGRIQLAFKDNTLMTLGRNSEMRITKYFWKPGDTDSVMETDVKEGSFRIMGGAITRIAPNNFKTNSPSGTIGIRGSMYAVLVEDNQLMVVFQGGKSIYVENDMGTVNISKPGYGLKVESRDHAPGAPTKMTIEQLQKFEDSLASAPEDAENQVSSDEPMLSDNLPLMDDTGPETETKQPVFEKSFPYSVDVKDIVSAEYETALTESLTPTTAEQTIVFMLEDLGFTGQRSTSTPSSGIWVYEGKMLNTLSDEPNEKMEFVVNWDNNRIMILEDRAKGEHDLIHGFAFGTIKPNGRITNVSVYGSDNMPGENVMALSGYETFGHFYGTGTEGIGIAMEGHDVNIQDQTDTKFWSDVTAGVVAAKFKNPDTGPAQESWNGFFIGVAENMSSPNTDRRVYQNTSITGFELNIDKTNGTIGGNMFGTDFNDGTNSMTINDFGGNLTDSVYISKKLMASSLDTGKVNINGPENDFKLIGNYIVTSDKGQLSSHTSWGHWEVAYVDPANGFDYHVHIPGSMWIAGEKTSDAEVNNLIATNFTGNYTGLAKGVMFDSTSQMSELTNGTTNLEIQFGGTPSVDGVISFDQVDFTVNGNNTITSAGFSAPITGLEAGSVVNGSFFGPNAKDIGGNFSATEVVGGKTYNYHGIFAGTR